MVFAMLGWMAKGGDITVNILGSFYTNNTFANVIRFGYIFELSISMALFPLCITANHHEFVIRALSLSERARRTRKQVPLQDSSLECCSGFHMLHPGTNLGCKLICEIGQRLHNGGGALVVPCSMYAFLIF